MSMNPYFRFLEGRDPLQVAKTTAGEMQRLVAAIGEDGMQRPYAPGKWTVAQIICHMADVEIGWGMRLRQSIAQPHHVIQPYDQDDWAKPYSQLDWHLALSAFVALRAWNMAYLGTAAKAEYGKPVTHPERGTMTFQELIETLAGHDLNHLAQLQAVAGTGK